MSDGLFKKFLTFSYGSWIGLVIGFLGTIITTRILMPEDFGKASMFTLALNVLMIIIMFGTDQSFIRFFYEEEIEKRRGLLYNCIRIPVILSLFLITVLLVLNRTISIWLFEEESLLVVLFLCMGIIAQILYRYSTLVIRMQQKGKLYSNLHIIHKMLSIIILILFYFFLGASYKIIVYSTVINLLIIASIAIWSEKKFWNKKNRKIKNLKHKGIEIVRFGSPLVITILITWLFESFDKIAIRHWSDFNELGLYAAAYKIVALVSVLQTTFSTFWTPVAYEKFENEPEDKKFYEKIFKIVSFTMFLVAIISIAGKDVIVYLLGREYRDASNIMPFLVFMPILYTISEITVVGINFFKKPKWHVLIASIACIVNIFGNWVLVPLYGALGASVSTAFSYIVFFVLRTQISQIYYKINYNLYKTYLMLMIISAYALFSVITNSFYHNILVGMIVLLALVIFYIKDVKMGYKTLKNLKAFDKIKRN
jgi:O-antigen/teichoic acid export membrane protein